MKEAETIVLEKFPKKVLELNALLEGPQFAYARLQELLPDVEDIVPVPINGISDKEATQYLSGVYRPHSYLD